MSKQFLRKFQKQQAGTFRLAWYLMLVSSVLMIIQNGLLAYLFAFWLEQHQLTRSVLFSVLPYLAVCWFLRPIINYGRDQLLLRASVSIRLNLRSKLLRALACLGPERSVYGSDGALSTQVLEQVDALDGYFIHYVLQQKLAVIVPLMIVGVTFIYSPFSALLLLFTAPLVPVFMILLGEAAARKNRQQLVALAGLSGRFLDLLRGMSTLRRLGAISQAQLAVDTAAESYRVRTMGVLKLAFLSTAVLELFAALAIALVAVYLGLGLLGVLPWALGSVPVHYQGALFILLLAPEFYLPLRQLGADYHDKAKAEAAVSNLLPLLEVAETTLQKQANKIEYALLTPPDIRAQKLCVLGRDQRIRLSEIDFMIKAKERVLIYGASGIGKSSLLQALLGFSPYKGDIWINEQNYADINLSLLHQSIAYLAQTPPIMALSIADNLRLAKSTATDDELREVLQLVRLWDFIDCLPQKMNTVLGERGQGMSGGQLQRLALAQMLLRNAPLWLLDEPTAHLDTVTAAEIMTLLDRISVGKTVLLISHDTSYTQWIDRQITVTAVKEV
ncbi:MAG: thiol reductant ABC exporter subunit CydD [Snodgrassella sp.]|nr:thiol reductant ABC exporter subunit CydD [Snodgrassella sp.]